jgi:hypothetical protein
VGTRWFTESLGTPVLQEAKALVKELADASALPASEGLATAGTAAAGG